MQLNEQKVAYIPQKQYLCPAKQRIMRVVVQRVTQADVRIEGTIIGEIRKGFLLLVGITHTDIPSDAEYLAKKVAQLRVFEDCEGKMNLSIKDVGGEILSISQFTLYADARHGNRPSFVKAARPGYAKPLYEYFNTCLHNEYDIHVETGRFGANMKVEFINDGPVTILLDSENR